MAVPNQNISLQQLRDIIDGTFNDAELRQLCFDLDIPYEDLGAEGKAGKVVELVRYCERHHRMQDLIEYVQRARPSAWRQFTANQPGPEQKYQSPPGLQQNEFIAESPLNLNSNSVISEATTDSPSGSDIDDAQPDEPEPTNPFQTIEPHNGLLLTTWRGISIYGLQTPKPWNLPVDAFVLPLDYGADYRPGQLASTLEEALEGTNAPHLADAFRKTLQSQSISKLTAEAPFFIRGETPSDLWTLPTTDRRIIAATANDGEGPSTDHAAAAAKAIIQLAMDNDCRSITIPALGTGSGGLPETAVALKMLDAILEAIPQPTTSGPALDEIILTTLNADTLAALRQKFMKRPQAALNDRPIGRDLLQVETAVYALAEMCLLDDLSPPLAVGVLGGWGSGKSFVMHLMQERVAELRRLKVSDNFPYIGHVYQITFDAWTYAKSNLWASLMQTIFYELNNQLTRERAVAQELAKVNSEEGEENQKKINEALKNDSPLWQLISYPNLRGRNSQELVSFAFPLHEKFRHTPAEQLAGLAAAWLRSEEPDQLPDDTETDTAVAEEDRLWVELRNLKAEEHEKLRQKEEALAKSRQELEEAQIELKKEVNRDLEKESRSLAWNPLKNQFKKQFGIVYRQIEQRFTQEDEDSSLAENVWYSTKALVQMVLNNPIEFLAFLLFAVFLYFWQQSGILISGLDLPNWLLPAGSAVAGWARSYSKWASLIQDSFKAYQKQVEEERSRLESTRSERYEQKLAKQKEDYLKELKGDVERGEVPLNQNVPALQDKVTKLEAETERLRQRVGMTAGFVSLLDFVSSRLDDAVYEKELGLMHQVQRDLRELSDSLTALKTRQSLFPRGKPRILLYIDDLDRCPPERVVEVLEAVQLLLKTDLFIVVLAVDVRFITRALEAKYKGILNRRGNPSGLDYIEKIIQIPYRIRPIEESAVANYLGSQMIIAKETEEIAAATEPTTEIDDQERTLPDDDARVPDRKDDVKDEDKTQTNGRVVEALPIEAIEIDMAEYLSMENCCRQIVMTPRAIKRLTNVYKLIKIIWYREGSKPSKPGMTKLVLVLLALSECYPNQMRDLFEALTREFKRRSETKLLNFIKVQSPEEEKDNYISLEWKHFILDAEVLIPEIAIREIDQDTFNLVRSFCFVGDIGYDPGESSKVLGSVQIEKSNNLPADSSSNSHENKANS